MAKIRPSAATGRGYADTMARGTDDDALAWGGDDDPTLDVGANANPDATPAALPKGYSAVGKGSEEVGRIRDDGSVIALSIAESSGRSILDQEAMMVMKKASPLALKHPLGKSQITILVPISYRLDG